MATLEKIKPYLDKRIGLCGHLFMDYDPSGEGYGHQDIFIYTTSNPEWYLLNLCDYSTMENMWSRAKERVEFLETWPNLKRMIGTIPHVGKHCLDDDNWQLDVDSQSHAGEN